ncbi:MAG TPA: response regulator [Burkholderiaceae bacterium]|jgi:CheY-like chemotaxis protein|nr:response regulator [Burkholderiaceae bacterium]
MNAIEAEPPCVLLVDDDPAILESYSLIFSAAGYRVRCAKDGAQALNMLRHGDFRPCLVVLDLMMPGVDGFEFLARRAQDEQLRSVPVIVCSSIDDLSPFRAAGDANAWLPKPVDVPTLLQHAAVWGRATQVQ